MAVDTMRAVVKGLEIQMTSEEVKGHLDDRAQYHADKAKAYAAQIKSLQVTLAGEDDGQNTMSNNPIQSLQMSASGHSKKADYFSLLAAHIVADAVYRLQEHELERLEWFSRY